MLNPERRDAVIGQLCDAISLGTDYKIETDCFCTPIQLPDQWQYEFSQNFLDALCANITEFTKKYCAERSEQQDPDLTV